MWPEWFWEVEDRKGCGRDDVCNWIKNDFSRDGFLSVPSTEFRLICLGETRTRLRVRPVIRFNYTPSVLDDWLPAKVKTGDWYNTDRNWEYHRQTNNHRHLAAKTGSSATYLKMENNFAQPAKHNMQIVQHFHSTLASDYMWSHRTGRVTVDLLKP